MRAAVYDERGGAFARLRGKRVLIYWPHGFGDFVHFGYVAAHLSDENVYRIARFGDAFTHLYDGNLHVAPLYTGIVSPSAGPPGFEHLGIAFKRIRNREMEVAIPPPLSAAYFRDNLDTILYTDYPEYEGRAEFPFHTKARRLLRDLITPERLERIDLEAPLRSALTFVPSSRVQAGVDRALRAAGIERFVLLAPGGHTNVGKAWAPQEAARLRDRLIARGIATVGVDEASFAALFAEEPLPFSQALLGLLARASAFVGAAAGPLHAALARGGLPIVGLWSHHYPDWYDEPCASAVHFVSARAIRAKLHERPATTSKPAAMRDRIEHVESDVVPADLVEGALLEAGL